MPYVYLIQPAELVGTNRYKIGMSRVNNLSRLQSYKVGTRYIFVCECADALVAERKLVKQFYSKYKRIAGNEYFEVSDEREMTMLFIDTIMNHKDTKARWRRDPADEPASVNPVDWMTKFAHKR